MKDPINIYDLCPLCNESFFRYNYFNPDQYDQFKVENSIWSYDLIKKQLNVQLSSHVKIFLDLIKCDAHVEKLSYTSSHYGNTFPFSDYGSYYSEIEYCHHYYTNNSLIFDLTFNCFSCHKFYYNLEFNIDVSKKSYLPIKEITLIGESFYNENLYVINDYRKFKTIVESDNNEGIFKNPKSLPLVSESLSNPEEVVKRVNKLLIFA